MLKIEMYFRSALHSDEEFFVNVYKTNDESEFLQTAGFPQLISNTFVKRTTIQIFFFVLLKA